MVTSLVNAVASLASQVLAEHIRNDVA